MLLKIYTVLLNYNAIFGVHRNKPCYKSHDCPPSIHLLFHSGKALSGPLPDSTIRCIFYDNW